MNPQLASLVSEHQHRINHYLEQALADLPSNEPSLKAAMQYGLLLGGKRIRPLLVYLVGSLNQTPLAQLDAAASAIEAIHAYSLIHDDLPAMDDDALRRGQATCHIAFDEATAILAGDALQSFAFEQLANAPLANAAKVELFKQLSKAAGYQGMCGGQALDIQATDKQISLQQLEQVHALKTGALIEAAVSMGAIAAGLNQQEQQQLQRYAQCIGLAFQVRDDILDVIGDTKTLGKPQGSDQAANKSTYPALLGLEGAVEKAENLHKEALQALQGLPYNSEMLALLADYVVNRDK